MNTRLSSLRRETRLGAKQTRIPVEAQDTVGERGVQNVGLIVGSRDASP